VYANYFENEFFFSQNADYAYKKARLNTKIKTEAKEITEAVEKRSSGTFFLYKESTVFSNKLIFDYLTEADTSVRHI